MTIVIWSMLIEQRRMHVMRATFGNRLRRTMAATLATFGIFLYSTGILAGESVSEEQVKELITELEKGYARVPWGARREEFQDERQKTLDCQKWVSSTFLGIQSAISYCFRKDGKWYRMSVFIKRGAAAEKFKRELFDILSSLYDGPSKRGKKGYLWEFDGFNIFFTGGADPTSSGRRILIDGYIDGKMDLIAYYPLQISPKPPASKDH